jgi:DNA polymerase-1
MEGLGALLRSADSIIGHNFISYDYLVLERFLPGCINQHKVIDTLVLSRLLKYKPNDGNGHGLEAWGARLEVPKLPSPPFDKFSEELVTYCKQDVEITAKLYEYLMEWLGDPGSQKAVEAETQMAWVCLDIHLNGFKYDKERADNLKKELECKLLQLDADIRTAFPPKLVPVREITPKLTKHGTISRVGLPRDWTDLTKLSAGSSFTLVRREEFNPGSPKQINERLAGAGWQPTVRTTSGNSFKVCEENLATLPESAPEGARKLVERLLIASRVRTLQEWEDNYRSQDGRIHGIINPIGTWTGRCSHRSPNMGNIAAEKSIKYKGDYLKQLATTLGGSMRSLWGVDNDSWLIGCDAEGIQLRVFAHYINDPSFTKALVEGKKEDGTDPHSLNGSILGCSRDSAKTFIYAFLLGAGDRKLADILGRTPEGGTRAKQDFIHAYPGLRELRERTIPRDAGLGFFVGFDGRRVYCNSEHLMLAGYLQNGEATIMKHANLIWRKKLNGEKILYKQVNFVHDEWQTEYGGRREVAEYIGRVQSESIKAAGEALGLRCPMAGQYQVATNWRDTH